MAARAAIGEPGVTGPRWPEAAGLAGQLADLAIAVRRASADQPAALAAVTLAAAAIVPGADGAALIRPAAAGGIEIQAGVGDLAQAVAELCREIGSGPFPALSAESLIPDTRADQESPSFGARAAALGVAGLIVTPLPDGAAEGSLLLVSRTPRAFSAETLRLAAAIAAHAAIVLAGAEERRQLAEAVRTRDIIGQAKGILMERHQITADAAFDALSRVSQDTNTRLRDVAAELGRTGALPRPGDVSARRAHP